DYVSWKFYRKGAFGSFRMGGVSQNFEIVFACDIKNNVWIVCTNRQDRCAWVVGKGINRHGSDWSTEESSMSSARVCATRREPDRMKKADKSIGIPWKQAAVMDGNAAIHVSERETEQSS